MKTDWGVGPAALLEHARQVGEAAREALAADGIEDEGFALSGASRRRMERGELRKLPKEAEALLLGRSISPLPLHKTLVLLEELSRHRQEAFHGHELLALAKALVSPISNLHFGPEVGVGPAKADAPVLSPWLANVAAMAEDLRLLRSGRRVKCFVYRADSRSDVEALARRSVDAVITSPPYPNEKDYTRTTRLESVLRGFKRTLVRSNTRNVYRGDDDDEWIRRFPEIHRIAEEIEARRVAMGKTSGFERMYAKVTRLYFGGMARHFAWLRNVLRPGARLAYVVGDQASYLRVMIRTGQLLAGIAESLGYGIEAVDLFRTRLATATRQQLREEVVVLRRPGERRTQGEGTRRSRAISLAGRS